MQRHPILDAVTRLVDAFLLLVRALNKVRSEIAKHKDDEPADPDALGPTDQPERADGRSQQ
jgi:hypothetical protein